jgi:threonine dehydratase
MKNAVLEAHARIAPHIRLTECRYSPALSRAAGAEVFLKLENHQLSGSFKLRGVMNRLLTLAPDEKGKRLIAASTGNHGAAFAHGVTQLGLEGLLFLPKTVTVKKLEAIAASGIPYELVGDDCVVTENHAHAFAVANDDVWVSPYNDPAVVAGQGTIGPELREQVDGMGAVLIPVGGGGLAAGIAGFLKHTDPEIATIGCEPAASPVMSASIAAGEIIELPNLPTLSDATAGGIEEGSITFDLCRRYVDRYELVSEDEIAAAIRFLHNEEDLTVEGGAALAVAVMLRRPPELEGKRVALVITGSKIDPAVLQRILSR